MSLVNEIYIDLFYMRVFNNLIANKGILFLNNIFKNNY